MIIEAMTGIAALPQGLPEQGALFDYVKAVFHSKELIQFGTLAVTSLLGMTGNYIYKWLRDEVRGSLYMYMFGSYPRRALLAIGAVISWALFVTGTSITDGAGWSALINLGLTTGFAFDAILNKADKVVWTEEERAERLGLKPISVIATAPLPPKP